jgi:sporulation protein YlmC with PRC-barrel domain
MSAPIMRTPRAAPAALVRASANAPAGPLARPRGGAALLARPPARARRAPVSAPRPAAAYGRARAPAPGGARPPPRPAAAPPAPDDVLLPRSALIDKEVITRTSGRRLGYVNQIFVDPARLEVVALYLRASPVALGAASGDHVLLSSLRQVGDVVLVHDEAALLDPPADEAYGYLPLVGTEVVTEDGVPLGRVRDFVFSPDSGALALLRYDALGLPSIPQALLSCSSLAWDDITAVGPARVVARRGAERRAVRENEGWVSEYVSALVGALAGGGDDAEAAAGFGAGGDAYRADPAYAEWYRRHAGEYERYYGEALPVPVAAAAAPPPPPRRERPAPPPPPRPMALPPPQSTPFRQAVQAQPAAAAPQRARQAVPVGAAAWPPPTRRARQPPPTQQQQQQQQGLADAQDAARRRPPPGAAAARPIPQTGIPIVGPPSPGRRRDADGGYGEPAPERRQPLPQPEGF